MEPIRSHRRTTFNIRLVFNLDGLFTVVNRGLNMARMIMAGLWSGHALIQLINRPLVHMKTTSTGLILRCQTL
jgi:gentisate 1,2-dioxygenase